MEILKMQGGDKKKTSQTEGKKTEEYEELKQREKQLRNSYNTLL